MENSCYSDTREKCTDSITVCNIFAVTVDAAVDGILIGLALSAEHAAGISMAIATIIEVNFFVFLFSSIQ